jgi:preprotein translocase subunit SecB
MADEGNVTSSLKLDGMGEDALPSAGIISQYVKDLSVENPNAPESFSWQDAPALDVQFNIAARAVQDDVHEVELKVQISAKAQAGTQYLVELSYCGLVGMRNLEETQAHAFLFAEAPRILFPFARRVVADAVRDAGFAPIMLEPIDFNGLYFQQLAEQAARAEANAGMPEPQGNA